MAFKLPIPGGLKKAEKTADKAATSKKADVKQIDPLAPTAKPEPAKSGAANAPNAKPASKPSGGFSLFGFGKKNIWIFEKIPK